MASNWSLSESYVSSGSSASLSITVTTPPATGDLLVVSFNGHGHASPVGGSWSASSVSQTGGSGSWTAGPATAWGAGSDAGDMGLYWKIATSSDASNLSAITINGSGSGTFTLQGEYDDYTLSSGTLQGIDLSATASGGSTSLSASPSSGSSQSSNTDELAVTVLSMNENSTGGITGTNTFTGTSAAANLVVANATSDTILVNQYVGGVQASATAGSNVFENTWTTSGTGHNIAGATFYYTAGASSLNVPVSDSTTTSEAVGYYSELVATREAVTVQISAAPTTPAIGVSDATTTSESLALLETVSVNVSDATTTSESLKELAQDFISVSDSTTTSEVLGQLAISFITVADSTTTSESYTVAPSFSGTSVTDSTVTSEAITLSVAESINVSDLIVTEENRSSVFYDGFENGFVNWTQSGTTISTTTSPVYAGTYAAEFNVSSSTATITDPIFSADQSTAPVYYTFQYYHAAYPSASTVVARLLNHAGSQTTGFKVNTIGQLVGKNADSSDGATVGTLSVNTWHFIEHWYDPNTGINRARIDLGNYTTWTNSSTAAYAKLSLGIANSAIYINYFDEVNLSQDLVQVIPTVNISVSDSTTTSESINVVTVSQTFSWMGYNWSRRATSGGPEYNSQWEMSNVIGPDSNGYITLRVSNPTGSSPYGSEMDSSITGWGYGTYTVVVGSALNSLYQSVNFGGLFLYDSGTPVYHNEIDINETTTSGGVVKTYHTYWYNNGGTDTSISQNYSTTSDTVTTHVMTWSPSQIVFDSYSGLGTSGTNLLHTVATTNIPAPNTEQVILNNWVNTNGTPANTPQTDVVLQAFYFARNVTVSDSTATSENITVSISEGLAVSDSTSTSESYNATVQSSISASDSTNSSETTSVVVPFYLISVNDSTATAETLRLLALASISVNDSTTTSEVLARLEQSFISVSDSTTSTEALTLLSLKSIAVNDSTSTTENVTVQIIAAPAPTIAVSDSTTTSETITITSPLEAISVADSTVTGETITLVVTSFATTNDSTSTAEAISLLESVHIAVSDSTSTTEAYTELVPTYSLSVSDSTATSEAGLNVLDQDGIAILEATTTSETITVQTLSSGASVADSATTSETYNVCVIFDVHRQPEFYQDGPGVKVI